MDRRTDGHTCVNNGGLLTLNAGLTLAQGHSSKNVLKTSRHIC